jgi:hypothetical protein
MSRVTTMRDHVPVEDPALAYLAFTTVESFGGVLTSRIWLPL